MTEQDSHYMPGRPMFQDAYLEMKRQQPELDRIRADLRYLLDQALDTQDVKALRRLQTSIVRWIENNQPKENDR